MTHTYKTLHSVSSQNTPAASINSEAVQRHFYEGLSKKLGTNIPPSSHAFQFFVEQSTPGAAYPLNQTEVEMYAEHLPPSLINTDGTVKFDPQLVAQSYREALEHNKVPLHPGYEFCHENAGRVLEQKGVDLPNFTNYKQLHDIAPPSWESMGVKNPIPYKSPYSTNPSQKPEPVLDRKKPFLGYSS